MGVKAFYEPAKHGFASSAWLDSKKTKSASAECEFKALFSNHYAQ